jgi:hypothetical protein
MTIGEFPHPEIASFLAMTKEAMTLSSVTMEPFGVAQGEFSEGSGEVREYYTPPPQIRSSSFSEGLLQNDRKGSGMTQKGYNQIYLNTIPSTIFF